MTAAEARAAIASIWSTTNPLTDQLADQVEAFLANPAIPMIMRCMAMAKVLATVGDGLETVATDPDGLGVDDLNRIHMIETLPDLVVMLRAAADLFESANRLRAN